MDTLLIILKCAELVCWITVIAMLIKERRG